MQEKETRFQEQLVDHYQGKFIPGKTQFLKYFKKWISREEADEAKTE